jgi:spoIIIJ-associated protein
MDKQNLSEKVSLILSDFSRMIGYEAETAVNVTESEKGMIVEITLNSENLGFLIGYHGKNLESFQGVLQLMLNRVFEGGIRVLLNVNNYREQREEALKEMAMRAVEYVRANQMERELSPMKPNERRIVHLALQELTDITTDSIGEGEDRRIVIKLKEIN